MAGVCAGLGLATDASGHLYIAGPQQVSWPNEAKCRIDANNGLRVDPINGKLWVPPDPKMTHVVTHGTDSTATPGAAGTVLLTHLVHKQKAPACSDCQFVAVFSGGFIGSRMGSGNWWQVERSITTTVNGVVVGFTGSQPVAAAENNSGGVLGFGGGIDPLTLYVPVPAGQEVKLDVTYNHHRITWTTAAANGITWRPPAINGFLFTIGS